MLSWLQPIRSFLASFVASRSNDASLFFIRTDFKDYSLQSRLHFRIHAAQNDLRSRDKAARKTGNGSAGATPEVDDVMPMAAGSNGLPCPLNEEEAAKILQGK